ncbi:hypothetical protein A9Y87_13740 [Salmonella enterica subsp. enterica]|nr:hypothetical protein A9Y87_13740 [Salmonella enterica subsp. enterica]
MVDPHYIARGDFTFEAGANALKQLLEQPLPPTAVFCHSDVMALGALSWAKRQGLSLSLTRLRTGIKTQWHCGRSALHRPWRLYL